MEQIVNNKKQDPVLLGIVGVALGFGAAVILAIMLNYFGVVDLKQLSPELFGWMPTRKVQVVKPKTGQEPTPTSQASFEPQEKLDTCSVRKEGNALVKDVRTLQIKGKPVVVGVFRGNINSVVGVEAGRVKIEVISPKGEQSYTLTVLNQPGVVYDAVNQKDLSTEDLKAGQTVEVSFNCFKDGNKEEFKIARVAITGL